MIHPDLCGLFGKVPQQPDFVSHNIDKEYERYFHEWMQSSMVVSQEQLGDQWLDQYLVAPLWNFAISPGVLSHHAWVGVLMPSVDEIGRYFPLLLTHPGNHAVWSALLNGSQWYGNAMNIMLSVLQEDTGYSDILGALDQFEAPDFSPALNSNRLLSSVTSLENNEVIQGAQNNALALQLLPTAMQERYGPHSLWWTEGSDHIPETTAICSGMPEPSQYAAFLDGDWQQWGWREHQLEH